jgi:endoglucanase
MKKITSLILCACLLLASATNTRAQTPVQKNGQLRVIGTKLCNQYGNPIQLRGMSTHGIQWYGWGSCLTEASLDALANDWGADILRISLYVQEGGYETDPAGFTAQVNRLIEEATERGMYALVDWHQLDPGDPNANLSRAKTFFSAIANQHKNKNNIIYDICNEPNGSGTTWARIKTYADQMIPFIRAIDNDAVICVGTHGWSTFGLSGQGSLQDVINNPLNYPNVMYTFHFYAKDHRTEYLNQLNKASDVFPVFVTEFGTQEASGDGPNDFAMAQQYIDLMRNKKISWTNWNYSDDFRSGAVWTTGTCSNGPWTTARLKPAGAWVRERMLNPVDDFPGGTPTCEPVTASSNDGNVPANVLDNNLNTRWSASGDGQWIQFCLNTPTTVSGVQIAFYQGNARSSIFDLQTSDDGLAFTTVASNVHSSGTSLNLETFSFTPRTAKYVRILGHGNSVNAWNSYTEVKIQTGTGGGNNQLFTLLPAQDAYVRDGANATLVHGVTDSTLLMTKINPTTTTGNNRESYLLFDANSVTGTINSVKLKVYGKVDQTAVASIPVGVFSVANTSWTENSLTWNNKPATGSTALASADIPSAAYSYAIWDVTSYVRSEITAGRKLIALSLKSLASNDSRIFFNSAETGNNPPQLVIDATTSSQRMLVSSLIDQSTATGTSLQSYPNPFRNNNTVVFNLETPGHVYLSVFDLTGKEVAVLMNGNLAAGSHRANFEPRRLPAGIYTLKMVHNGKILTTKLVKE